MTEKNKTIVDVFEFRRDGVNPYVDASSALMGLAVRLNNMTKFQGVEALYKQVSEEIRSIEIELTSMALDRQSIVIFQYLLFGFLDEFVLEKEWGASSDWGARSLLSQFHHETRGGERFFSLLTYLEMAPQRHASLLVFIYHCLLLGFKGKYGKEGATGEKQREDVINRLKVTLDEVAFHSELVALPFQERVVTQSYQFVRQRPLWTLFAGFFALWVGTYAIYRFLLNEQSAHVLTQLNLILS